MYKTHLFSILFLLFSGFVYANNPENITGVNTDPCDLPAPDVVNFTEKGHNWLKLEWTAVAPGNVRYRVKTYKYIGNILIGDVIVVGNTYTISGLGEGILYYAEVNAICPDGVDSPNKDHSGPDNVIVNELVVTGYTNSPNPSTCGVNAPNQYCIFDLNNVENKFKIQNNNYPASRQFVIIKPTGNEKLRGWISSVGGQYTFKIDDKDPDESGQTYQIYFNGGSLPIATFTLSEFKYNGQQKGKLTCTSMASGYSIVRLTPVQEGMQRPDGDNTGIQDERNEKSTPVFVSRLSPNPFTDQLTVRLDALNTESKVTAQLLNVNGQIIRTYPLDAILEENTLPTGDLPAGFYMFRLIVDGIPQSTVKLVKSE